VEPADARSTWMEILSQALAALASQLDNPRLTADPPPYRPSPVLRGPIHLPVAYDARRTR